MSCPSGMPLSWGWAQSLGICILSLVWVGMPSRLPTPVVCRSALCHLTFPSLAMEMFWKNLCSAFRLCWSLCSLSYSQSVWAMDLSEEVRSLVNLSLPRSQMQRSVKFPLGVLDLGASKPLLSFLALSRSHSMAETRFPLSWTLHSSEISPLARANGILTELSNCQRLIIRPVIKSLLTNISPKICYVLWLNFLV